MRGRPGVGPSDSPGHPRVVFRATRPGFEPGKAGPKPAVIPFHHRVSGGGLLVRSLATRDAVEKAGAISYWAWRFSRRTARPQDRIPKVVDRQGRPSSWGNANPRT